MTSEVPNCAFGFANWTTAGRPPANAIVRGQAGYNTDIGALEWWDGAQWVNTLATQSGYYIIPGLVADGVTDNTTVIQAAADASDGLAIAFPPGSYVCGAVTWPSSCKVIGLGNVTIKATGTLDSMWLFEAGAVIDGINFLGPIYSALGDVPAVDTLLRFEKSAGADAVSDIKILRSSFSGAKKAIAISQGLRVTINDVDIYRPYEWGVIAQLGTQKLIIDGLRVREVGLYEGIKLGAADQPVTYSDILINNFFIESCGRLAASSADWQEGIDLYTLSLQRMKISNGIIRNCGHGGIEAKKTSGGPSPDTYENVTFEDIYVESDTDHGGAISLNWTGSAPGSPNTALRVRIDNLNVKYTGGGTASTFGGVGVMAWTDIELVNSTFDYVHVMLNMDGTGSSDSTVRRPYVARCKATNVTGGITFANGSLENAIVEQNYISTASSYAVFMESGTGIVRNNILVSATDAVRFDAGTWEYADNRVTTPDASRGWTTTGAPTVSASGNKRGYKSSAPGTAGAIGDQWLNSAPSAGGTEKWLCTTAGGSGVAVWKGTAIAA